MDYIKQLQTKGYCVIPNVLSETQINHAKYFQKQVNIIVK